MLVKVFLLLAASLVVGYDLKSDTVTLNEFYKATSKNGPWKSQSGWGTTASVCSWSGISCGKIYVNGTDVWRVVGVKLDQNNLQGSIPASFTKLDELNTLILSQNNIEGAFPEVGLTKLTKLDLSYNAFSGTFDTGLHQDLKHVDLSNNYFEGNIQFTYLTPLEDCDVSGNLLTCPVDSRCKSDCNQKVNVI